MSENEFDIAHLSSAEIKCKIQRDGIWPQYTQRLKSLERTQKEFWKLFAEENDSGRKLVILEDLVNLQSVLAICYDTAKKILLPDKEIVN